VVKCIVGGVWCLSTRSCRAGLDEVRKMRVADRKYSKPLYAVLYTLAALHSSPKAQLHFPL
jgi:hypothetical protein